MFYGFVFKVKLPGSESCTSAAAQHSPGAGAPWGGGSHPQLLQCLGTQELGSDPRAAPQRRLRSPGLLQKEEGEGAVGFSALLLPAFIKYKICVHARNSQNQLCLLQRLDLQILHCQQHDESTSKQSVCWRGGQLSYLCTPQPPEALLSAGSLWSSCSMLPSAAGPVLGGKPRLGHKFCHLDTSGAHSQKHQRVSSSTDRGTGISFL